VTPHGSTQEKEKEKIIITPCRREVPSCCIGIGTWSMGVDLDKQTKRTPSARGRGVLQIITIKITPHIKCKGMVIIIKIKKLPHPCKTQVKERVLL
jgi:hypothetical protein